MTANFYCKKADEPTTTLSAVELTAAGYRRVSSAYGLIARIDRADWMEHLATEMRCAPADFIVRDGSGKPSGSWCDYYRRCCSKDVHTVDAERFKDIPSSNGDQTGYIAT